MTVLFLCIICLGIALWHAVAVALAVAIFAPVGDLIESIVKRSFDIKDSGKISPVTAVCWTVSTACCLRHRLYIIC